MSNPETLKPEEEWSHGLDEQNRGELAFGKPEASQENRVPGELEAIFDGYPAFIIVPF